jgi:general stress protein 26
MVAVDADGRPRIRTVRAFRLAQPADERERFTVFVLMRLSTRKLEHIARNPLVTLYFNEDQRVTYATLMGRATVHRDPDLPRLREFLDPATVSFFWPDFPRDFVMVEVVPQWVEFIGPGLWNDPDTWRPQAVVFD